MVLALLEAGDADNPFSLRPLQRRATQAQWRCGVAKTGTGLRRSCAKPPFEHKCGPGRVPEHGG
jgi:hypothetical protein